MINKENKLVPKLRFPEFVNEGEWNESTLGEISDRIENKVGTRKLTTVSISAGVGFVSQAEKFSRDISGQQYKNYIVLKKGEFSYNKGNSKKFPQGCIYKLKEFDEVAAPNAFISFKFKDNYNGDFYQGYFDNNYHGSQLQKFITSGARMDGLLNISANDFFTIKFPTPKNPAEQQKIASCLSSLDELIAAHTDKLDALKAHKKGLMQQLFPADTSTGSACVPKLRFKEFEGDGEWVETTIEKIAKVTTGNKDTQNKIDDGKYPFFVRSQTVERINSYSYDGEAILTSGDGVGVGKNFHYINGKFDFHQRVYCIYDFGPKIYGKFIFMYFSQHFNDRVMRMSAKNSVDSVRMSMITEMPIKIPSKAEQQKIANFLSSIDDKIAAQVQKIEGLKEHKKGLMQGLFPQLSEL